MHPYDSAETIRIARSIRLLEEHAEQAWPHIVEHLTDDRYSVTICLEYSTTSFSNDSVGGVCKELIWNQLHAKWPDGPHSTADSLDWFRVSRHLPGTWESSSLQTWCRARANERLLKLQIDACQTAIDAIADLEHASHEEKQKAVDRFKKHLESLQMSCEPIKPKRGIDSVESKHFAQAPQGKEAGDRSSPIVRARKKTCYWH